MNKEDMKTIFPAAPVTENENKVAKRKKEPLKALTIRVTPTMYDAITFVAEQKQVSKSAVCRVMFADRMVEYLGTQNYVDINDGKKLIKLVGKVITKVERIRWELHRIGVNYNTQVRLMQIKEDYKDNVIKQMQEEKEIKKGINVVDIEAMRKLIDKQDSIITKTGEMACTLVSHPPKMAKVQ